VKNGFSLIELIVVVAIIGILATIGFVNLRRDRPQVREAARITAADLSRARSEAIRLNTRVALQFDPATNSYRSFEDANRDATSDTGRFLFERSLAEFALADLRSTNFTDNVIWFDARGLPQNSLGGFGAGSVRYVSTNDKNYEISIVLAAQGRIQVVYP
jgi:prepilin-type N-terminal cleavage/methylation domain-containing protein